MYCNCIVTMSYCIFLLQLVQLQLSTTTATATTHVATAPTTNSATTIDVVGILDNRTLVAVFNTHRNMIICLFIIVVCPYFKLYWPHLLPFFVASTVIISALVLGLHCNWGNKYYRQWTDHTPQEWDLHRQTFSTVDPQRILIKSCRGKYYSSTQRSTCVGLWDDCVMTTHMSTKVKGWFTR